MRQLVARTVILVLSATESLKGTVSADSPKNVFVLERPVYMEPGPDGAIVESPVDGTVWVDAARVAWVQVV